MLLPFPSDQEDAIKYLSQTTNDADAYTITCLYEIDTDTVSVMDARYVWANRKAKQMFGRPLGEAGHEWQSYTQDSITRFQSALLGLQRARTQNRDIYIAPIVLKNGEKRDVAKTVTALVRGHSIYYCTRIEPADRHPDAVHLKDIKLPDAEEFDYRHVFMSDIRELTNLGAFEMSKNRDKQKSQAEYTKNRLTNLEIHNSILYMQRARPKMTFEADSILVSDDNGKDILVYLGDDLGRSFWLEDGTPKGIWWHRCKFCGKSWRSRSPRPPICPKQEGRGGCNKSYWYLGAPPVRTYSERAKMAKNPGRKRRCAQS